MIETDDRLIVYLLHKKDFPKLAKLFQVSIGFLDELLPNSQNHRNYIINL